VSQYDFEEKPITYLMVDAEDIVNTKITIANYRFVNNLLSLILLTILFLAGFGGALLLLAQSSSPTPTPTGIKP
jgi:hypothetical protein